MPASSITRMARGCTRLASVPALWTSIRSPASARKKPSAIWLRAELCVQRTSTRARVPAGDPALIFLSSLNPPGSPPHLPRPDEVRGARLERRDDRGALGQAEIGDGARGHGGDEREADVDDDTDGRRRGRDAHDRPGEIVAGARQRGPLGRP